MTRRRALWPAATPAKPTPAVLLAHSKLAADALADGDITQACSLLDDLDIPPGEPLPWLAEIVAAVVLPDRAAWNQHDTDARPVPADMLVAVDLGEGQRPLIDRAGVFDWGPGCGPAGEGRIHRWVRIEGAGRPA